VPGRPPPLTHPFPPAPTEASTTY